MLPLSDLHFLQEKIRDLRNALFFSQNTSLLRIATTIVSILKVDELGQMWFFVPRPQQALHEFDREFPVRLEFFRKGKEFFLHVSGKAFIVNDPEEVNGLVHEDIRQLTSDHLVLIKVKMLKADYFEQANSSMHSSWWRDLRNQLHTWMFNTRPGYKPISTCFVIGAFTAFVGIGCGGNSSSSETAKDSNAAKVDSTKMDTGGSKMSSVPATVSQADQKFAVDAADAGMTEIEAAKVAQQQGVGADVKRYAAMIIKDHTEAADKLKAIATKKNLTLPAGISQDMRQNITDLQKKTGKDFDKAYFNMMIADHKEAVTLFKDESKNGSDADIRAFADATVHTLQHHLDEAQKCEKMMGKM